MGYSYAKPLTSTGGVVTLKGNLAPEGAIVKVAGLEKLVFTDLGDGRCRLDATSLVDDFGARDAFVASGMETGVIEGYERLDELLAR